MSDEVEFVLGICEFDKIIKQDLPIFDKTLFIKEFMNDKSEATCILRPRRFGKSTNLSMLKSFLSIGASPVNFERYLISKETEFVKKHCGQYPVVYLDLKDCKGETWEELYQKLWLCIRKMVARHEDVLTSFEFDLSPFQLNQTEVVASANTTFVSSTLDWLMRCLHKVYLKGVIVLVDEYDSPLNCAFRHGYYNKASTFFGDFYTVALKNNSALQKACLMGIVQALGSGILSGLNNLKVYSVAQEKYSSMFGLTEFEIAPYVDPGQIQEVLKWYNGYNIGSIKVINPWSFVSWLQSKVFESYWIETSYVETISVMLQPYAKSILAPILEILHDEKKSYEIPPLKMHVNYTKNLWPATSILHFLVLTGYLSYTVEGGKSVVSIPNYEILAHWKDEVSILAKDAFEPQFESELQNALRDLNTTEIANLMQKMLGLCSYHDVARSKENLYHMFFFGCFLAILHDVHKVLVTSNREAGRGRYDIRIQFIDSKKIIIFEFKKSAVVAKLDEDAENGLAQISTNLYYSDLPGYECLLIGVSFHGKVMSNLKFRVIET